LPIADDYERDFAALQVLPIAHVFVSRQQDFETRRFRGRYQLAVGESIPSSLDGFVHGWASSARLTS